MPATRPARLTALALLAACCAANALAPAYREPRPGRRTDEEKLQGTWELVRESFDGKATDRKGGEYTAVFAGRRVEFLTDGEALWPWPFTLDPTASPKRLDLGLRNDPIIRGIYRLEGDRLTLACGELGAPRPVDFKAGPGTLLAVYRRAKPGKRRVPSLFNPTFPRTAAPPAH